MPKNEVPNEVEVPLQKRHRKRKIFAVMLLVVIPVVAVIGKITYAFAKEAAAPAMDACLACGLMVMPLSDPQAPRKSPTVVPLKQIKAYPKPPVQLQQVRPLPLRLPPHQ